MDAFKGFPCWMHSREMVSITAELFSIEIIQDIELICHKIWIINYSTIRKTRNVAAVLIKNSHEPSSTIVLGNGMKIFALVGTKNARFEASSNTQKTFMQYFAPVYSPTVRSVSEGACQAEKHLLCVRLLFAASYLSPKLCDAAMNRLAVSIFCTLNGQGMIGKCC